MMKRITILSVFMMIGMGLLTTGSAFGAGAESKAVMAAAEKFYSALNAMFTGDLEPMKTVWSHAEDVTYMGPDGGFEIGWTDVLATWEKQAAMKLGGRVEPKDMWIKVGRDIAIAQNYEIGNNTDKDGNPQEVSIRATNIFRKEDGQWKMIGHHTDLLPYL